MAAESVSYIRIEIYEAVQKFTVHDEVLVALKIIFAFFNREVGRKTGVFDSVVGTEVKKLKTTHYARTCVPIVIARYSSRRQIFFFFYTSVKDCRI